MNRSDCNHPINLFLNRQPNLLSINLILPTICIGSRRTTYTITNTRCWSSETWPKMTLGASCGSQFQRACYIDAIVTVLFTVPSAVSNFSPSSGSYPISVQNLEKSLTRTITIIKLNIIIRKPYEFRLTVTRFKVEVIKLIKNGWMDIN